MTVTNSEISLLNFYRASELHGGLILGQMVRRTRDPELILNLTRHSAEEVMHAQLWTERSSPLAGARLLFATPTRLDTPKRLAPRYRCSRSSRSPRYSSAGCTAISRCTCAKRMCIRR